MEMTTILLIAGAVLVLALAAFVYARRRGGGEEAYYHVRCPGCRRRLRYRARQVGHAGACNNCGGRVTFPPVTQSVD